MAQSTVIDRTLTLDRLPYYYRTYAEVVDTDIVRWAEGNIVLPSGTMAPGPLRLTEPQRQILRRWQQSDTEFMALMTGVQQGKTTIFNIALAHTMSFHPCQIFGAFATEDGRDRFLTEKFEPLLNANPDLDAIVARNEKGDIPKSEIKFDGGLLHLAHSHSKSSMRSATARVQFGDEVDVWKTGTVDASNPLDVMQGRGASFDTRAKAFVISSPTIIDSSIIYDAYRYCSAEMFYVPCHACAVMDTLTHEAIIKTGHDQYEYQCPSCSAPWTDRQRAESLVHGEFRATNEEALSGHYSFWLSRLYSPFHTIQRIGRARDKVNSKQAFYTQVLGWPFTPDITPQPEDSWLRALNIEQPPPEPEAITVGADVQHNRIEAYEYHWWGGFDLPITVRKHVFRGDDLDARMIGLGKYLAGAQPDMTFLDRGGTWTSDIRTIAAKRLRTMLRAGKIMLVKGIDTRPGEDLVLTRQQQARFPYDLNLNVHDAKIWAHMYAREPEPDAEVKRIMRVVESGVDDDFWEQFFSERLRWVARGAKERQIWVKKPGVRNEALDCFVYALCARVYLGIDYKRRKLDPNNEFLNTLLQ